MSFVDTLLEKTRLRGIGKKDLKKASEKGLASLQVSFVSGQCPHKKAVYSPVFQRASADFKGDNRELSDFRTRRAVMDVSPRQTVGWEKNHVNGHCLTAERSLGAGTDRTRAMLGRLFEGTGRPADGHLIQNSRKARRTPTPEKALMQQAAKHIAEGRCTSLTKKQTLCQRKSVPGTLRCVVHAGASTTAGA